MKLGVRAAFAFLGAATFVLAQSSAPLYVSSSVVNAASPRQQPLAPNTIASLFGKNLAYVMRPLASEDIKNGELPTGLGGAGLRVFVGGLAAQLYFVSADQVNFLVPPRLRPGTHDLYTTLDGKAGPTVRITLAEVSPALFQIDPEYAVCARPDGTLVDRDHPAHPGEVVIFYANGLGWTRPQFSSGQIATVAAPLERLQQFRILFNEQPVDASAILYAGIAPGFAGLYQINVALPATVKGPTEIRIGFGETLSPAGVRVAVAE